MPDERAGIVHISPSQTTLYKPLWDHNPAYDKAFWKKGNDDDKGGSGEKGGSRDNGDKGDANISENRLVKTVTNHLITAGELINKALYLRRLKAYMKLQNLADEKGILDAAEEERVLSSVFGREINVLEYEGSATHMAMVEKVAKDATTGIWSFDEETDDEDEETDVEDVEGEPTPVQSFHSDVQFSCDPVRVTPPMILVVG